MRILRVFTFAMLATIAAQANQIILVTHSQGFFYTQCSPDGSCEPTLPPVTASFDIPANIGHITAATVEIDCNEIQQPCIDQTGATYYGTPDFQWVVNGQIFNGFSGGGSGVSFSLDPSTIEPGTVFNVEANLLAEPWNWYSLDPANGTAELTLQTSVPEPGSATFMATVLMLLAAAVFRRSRSQV